MRLRTRIAIAAGLVTGALAAALAAVPALVDLEAYKPGMIQAVRDATGRELVIDGPMKLSMFPVPGVGAGRVHFSNPVGARGAQMIDVQWVAVTPSLWALLRGRLEVGTLRFYRPTIALETDDKGRPNWEFEPGAGARQAPGAASSGLHLAIGRLELIDGKVTYTNPLSKKTFAAENVHGGATVRSLDGPFDIDATGTVNGVPLKLAVTVGDAKTGAGPSMHDAELSLEVASGKLDFKGAISAVSPDAIVRGHMKVNTGVLSDFVNAIVIATGAAKPDFDTRGGGAFAFDGDVLVSPERIAADGFDLKMGDDAASGSLTLGLTPRPSLAGKVKLTRLDLGRWIEILSRPIDFTPAPVKEVAPRAVAALPSFWSALNADVEIAIAETHFHRDLVRDLDAHLQARDGAFTLSRFKALLPGNMKIAGDVSTGRFSLAGSDLRHTLKWLDVDTEGVPAGKLKTLEIDGTLAAPAGRIDVTGARFALDGTPGTASGSFALKDPPVARIDAQLDQFDLDAYRPRDVTTDQVQATPQSPATPAAAGPVAKPTAADLEALKVGLKLKIARLAFRGETLNGADCDVTLQGDHLEVASANIADAVGAKVHMKGAVEDFGTAPRFDLDFDVAASDTDRLLHYARLPGFLNGKIGPSTTKGSVSGTSSLVTLRNVAANFLGTETQLSGRLGFSDPVAYDFTSFFLHTRDADALVSAAAGRAMKGVGYIRATGSLAGTSDKASFEGELRARGSRLHGKLETTLDDHPKVVAAFTVPGVLKVDRWLGIDPKSAAKIAPVEGAAESAPTPATSHPIDLAAFRAFDAKLSLQAETATLATLKVEQADIQATLSGGVVKIAGIKGAFYGGQAAFSGTVDASGKELSVDMTGDVQGIAIGRFLAGTLGKNTLSSSGFTVAIDGTADAAGMRITGRGISSEEIRNSLTGAAAIGGQVHPIVVDGSPAFARFAASIGGIFSTDLAFDAQVLRGFVGHQSPLSGRFELNAGGLLMQNLTVQGADAVARVNGRASFADDLLDTTVMLQSGQRRYVTTVKGPAAQPVLSTIRTSER